jgi:transcriptional regulator with XRE-family HTH domain
MDDAALGAALRALRHRRGWRQADLAERAAVSRSLVALLQSGAVERLSLPAARRIAAALGIRLRWDVGFRAQELARLRDAVHARLGEHLARRLETLGWLVAAEASFNNYGERGRIDLLAYSPVARLLVVIELKTIVVDVQATLGGLSVKTRVAPAVARGLGWRPSAVLPALVETRLAPSTLESADSSRCSAG